MIRFCGLPSRPGLLPNPQTQGVHYFLEKWSFRKTTPLTCSGSVLSARQPSRARSWKAGRSRSALDRLRAPLHGLCIYSDHLRI